MTPDPLIPKTEQQKTVPIVEKQAKRETPIVRTLLFAIRTRFVL